MQIKNNCVSIGALIGDGTTPSYKLAVTGSTYFSQSPVVNGLGTVASSGTLVVTSHSVFSGATISGGSNKNGDITITKSGYKVLGVVGFTLSSAYLAPVELYTVDDGSVVKLVYKIKNFTSSSASSASLSANVLWVKS